ncbi:hypothetical protein ACFX2I_026894 [Malus domestica]
MANPNPVPKHPLYQEIIQSNPEAPSILTSSAPNLYPSLDMKDLCENLFPEYLNPTYQYPPSAPPEASDPPEAPPSAPPVATEEVLIKIPGTIVNLIGTHFSVELASGDFTIIRLVHGDDIVAVLARVGDEIQ